MARADVECLKNVLLRQREFIAQKDLADECELKHRSTAHRILWQLKAGGYPIEFDERGRVRVDRSKLLLDLQLNLDEALEVYFACRLLARHSDQFNPHVSKALVKLGSAMRGSARGIGDLIVDLSAQQRGKHTHKRSAYVSVLETLVRAWADHTSVLLYTRKEPHTPRRFDPYFIEPAVFSNYVIGYDHRRDDIRTFKVQWLQKVSPTRDAFQVRADFNPYEHLGNAWGINWGKGKLETVRLRFTGNAAERVQDNVWHESQELKPLDDGAYELTVQVGDTKEMIPFVRQWGHECEVMEPEHFRKTIAEHARRMAELYDNARGR